MTALKALRERLREPAEAAGVKLSFLPFIVKATVAALRKHPMLNATLDEAAGEIVMRKRFHVGIATATDAGLMVPVIKDADRKSVLDIAREIERLAADARSGKSRLEDLQGSTFTITSLGSQGGLFATPIINFPEAAILGVHRMKEKPVVRGGQIAVGHVMLLVALVRPSSRGRARRRRVRVRDHRVPGEPGSAMARDGLTARGRRHAYTVQTMQVEVAQLDDLEDVARLLAAQFDEHSIMLDQRATLRAIRGAIEDPARGTFLIARDGAAPVGLAYLAYNWTLEHGGRSAWLEELYVVPSRRSAGVGTRLLREAMAHASRAGCAAIDLEVEADHARAARLYAREGFRAHTRARWVVRL